MRNSAEVIIENESDWLDFWQHFFEGRSDKILLLLEGEVGAGKTTSVAYLAKHFGASQAASPSFAIHHRYKGLQKAIDHVDLYRIENEVELEGTGFWDLFSQDVGIVVVEWPSRVADDHWPLGWEIYKIQYQKLDQNRRRIVTQLF